jgi:hypothetical protein
MEEPQVRANWTKFVLHCAKRADANGMCIADSIPDALRREIRESGRLAWQDIRILAELLEAVGKTCGALGSRLFWRASFKASLSQPMIAPLARGALMLWGHSPASFVRRTPQAWQLFTRNCGTLKVVPVNEPNAIMLRIENVPRACRVDGFLYMAEGGLESQMDYFRALGVVETRADHFPVRGFVELVARWEKIRLNQRGELDKAD